MLTTQQAAVKRPARKPKAALARKRTQHLRVPVFPEEKSVIEQQAATARVSVARYLREVGQGYVLKSTVNLDAVQQMAQINGDLGRLGNLLELFVRKDPRTAAYSANTIAGLLLRIKAQQEELGRVMRSVVQPAASPKF